jgi:MFS family permease
LQGVVLGAYFYGYIVTSLIAGQLTDWIGARWLIGTAILISGVLNLIIPVCAQWSVYAVIAVRILCGLVGVHKLIIIIMFSLANIEFHLKCFLGSIYSRIIYIISLLGTTTRKEYSISFNTSGRKFRRCAHNAFVGISGTIRIRWWLAISFLRDGQFRLSLFCSMDLSNI